VAAGQITSDLAISSFNLNGAVVSDGAGNPANLSGAANYNPAGTLQIDTTAPTIASIVESGTGITNGSGNVSTGQVVTLTVNLSEAVTVNTSGGAPMLALNDGGTATYTGGSGSTALTFNYTVAAGQTTSDLAVSSFNLNGAVVSDGAGNTANVSGAANYNPTGTLQVNATTTSSSVPHYSHIVVVVEENRNYDEIAGSSQAPYINSLMANGASLTNFTAEAHPSQPDYFALYAGSTFAVTDDNAYSLPDPTLYTALHNAGLSFTGYVDEGGGGSDFNHDPWVSFPEARTVQTDFTSFPALFSSGNYSSLPTVSFVIPSPGDDMHNGTIAQGDTWLQQNLSAYAQWALNNNSLLVVTWDENDDEATNQVPTLLYGANVVPGNYGTAYNHYNLLSTITASYGLTAPNNAATAAPIQVFGSATGGSAATIASIAASGTGVTNGTGDLNAGKLVMLTVNFSAAVTVNTAGGTPRLALNDGGTASYTGGSGGTALTFSYTVAAGQNTADLIVSSFNLNGAAITDGNGNAANLSGATNFNPAGTLQIDTTAPTIAISTIAGDNIVNATEGSAGFAISGTTTGAENGRVVTVNILNSANAIVNSYTKAVSSNAWSVAVTSAQATALADGSYTVSANVPDAAGNPAQAATRALTVDQDRVPEVPALTISSTSLTVPAGGSVALGITATPVDSDDRLSLKISGLPSYESITAPAGNTVTSSLQSNGTFTWTITEGSSTTGKPLTGLTLSSSYTGTGQPVATFTATASNTTSGETATSVAQTMLVTDPPVATSDAAGSSSAGPNDASSGNAGHIGRLAAMMDQFAAAGLLGDAAGAVHQTFYPNGGSENLALLAAPHFHTG
jgi:hypothetical protein